jgi:hypothetical protein
MRFAASLPGRDMTFTEIVWDREGAATATSGVYVLPVGHDAAWAPPQLLATAASASLLSTFIELATDARVPVLGYVAQQRLEVDAATEDVTSITIIVCISVPSEGDAARARATWTRAIACAPVLRVLKCPVVSESSIVVLSDTILEDGV